MRSVDAVVYVLGVLLALTLGALVVWWLAP